MKWLDRLLAEPGSSWRIDPTLELLCAGLPPRDALELREERAAILEFDGGFSREQAEQKTGLAGKQMVAA